MTSNTPPGLLIDQPHRRFNALTGEWVFVSPQRALRPWLGHEETPPIASELAYDPECYLCPGNARAGSERNPPYTGTFVFTNDFPAFLPSASNTEASCGPLLRAHGHAGICRVVCYSPRHDLSLAQMDERQIRGVIDTWAREVADLSAHWRCVQVFENRSELAGCSNPHPHGQIWAGDFIPNEIAKEAVSQRQWFEENGSALLLDYAKVESASGERVVIDGEHWLAVVPWWAVWPFETLLLPRSPVRRLPDLTDLGRQELAKILSELLQVYDRLFDAPMPYSFGWHTAPGRGDGEANSPDGWQLHAHFYPPSLRSASVRKFMVGYELLAEAQRDITPEVAAQRLRACRR